MLIRTDLVSQRPFVVSIDWMNDFALIAICMHSKLDASVQISKI